MKIKIIPSLISMGIALLLGYAAMSVNGIEPAKWILLAGTFITLFLTLLFGFGMDYGEKGSSVTALAIVFLIIFIVSNAVSCFFFNQTAYIVLNGILVLVYVGIVYALSKALKEV